MTIALALADFRDRARRPSFVVILVAVLLLAYYAVPPPSEHYTVFDVGNGYAGVDGSAYRGAVTALFSGMWLSVIGFYVVKNSIARDQSTGVGELLAATRMRNIAYTVGKALSNLLVLCAMTAVIALMTLILQLVRGTGSLNLIQLWLPFVFLTLPALAFSAAVAVAFESVPLLRTGFGNVLWFILWVAAILLGEDAASKRFPVDLIGLSQVSQSMGAALQRAFPHVGSHPVASIGVMVNNGKILGLFPWSGLPLTRQLLLGRGLWLLLALVIAALPSVWFSRFDPARRRARSRNDTVDASAESAVPAEDAAPVPASPFRRTGIGGPGTFLARGPALLARLIAGELRVLLAYAPLWWRLAALGLVVAGALLPRHASETVLLPLAWIWPMLIWARMGTHQHENGIDPLITTTSGLRRRTLAEWLAGVLVTASTGLGPLIRMTMAAAPADVGAWCGFVLFIPSLALALGTLTRSNRTFQFVYLALWYAAWSDQGRGVNLMGSPVTASILFPVAACLLAVIYLVREQHERFR